MEPPTWSQVVTDPREIPIFEALEDPQWEWRTLGALCRVSDRSEAEVRGILAKYPMLVRRSGIPSSSGEELYTLHSRYHERQNPFKKAWDFLGPSSSSSSSS